MRKVLIASLLTFQPSSAIPQAEVSVVVDPVPLVVCHNGDSYVSGSAFRVGYGLFISANHVTSNHNCEIDGQPVKVIYHHGDYSMLADHRPGKFIPVDCSGFHEGQHIYAVGHARGQEENTVIPMIATGRTEDGLAVLVGVSEAQPGMSGGAMIDGDTMKVVGVINAANWEDGTSFSIALKDMPICQR